MGSSPGPSGCGAQRAALGDLAAGRVSTYGFRIKATAPEDIPPSSTPAPSH